LRKQKDGVVNKKSIIIYFGIVSNYLEWCLFILKLISLQLKKIYSFYLKLDALGKNSFSQFEIINIFTIFVTNQKRRLLC